MVARGHHGGLGVSEQTPTLYPSGTELWQYTQAVTAISSLSGRLRARLAQARERDGRLAFGEAEHAARRHDARQHPALRLMTTDEQAEWRSRVPAALATAHHGEPVTVWTAQLAGADGAPSGEWGLEAHTWDRDRATSSLLAVCRDAEDALAMTRQLRAHGTPEALADLRHLASAATTLASPDSGALALSQAAWEAALRQELPTAIADKIIVNDPGHPHHRAWRELHTLANDEVTRGADPTQLAALVSRVPNWRASVRNPPALAHWAITQARTTIPSQPATTPTRPQLAEVRTSKQAHTWATSLDPANPDHRLQAKLGFGRWGEPVDRILTTRFPNLVQQATSTTTPDRNTATAEPATAAELAAHVNQLDPTKPIDRRAAHLMLGRVPIDIDRMLAAKFGHHPDIADKLRTLYPHGLPHPRTTTASDTPTGRSNAAAQTTPRSNSSTTVAGSPSPTSTRPTKPHQARPHRRA